jgi:hypothetical protein
VRGATADYDPLDSPTLVAVPRFHQLAELTGPRLTVLMPHLQLTRMTGGPNTILNLTGRLRERGIALRYVATFGPLDPDPGPLREHISALSGSPIAGREAELVAKDASIGIAPNEVLMATWWPTAYAALEGLAGTRASEFIYFIQDYEPGFYPWSTNHALALATYDFPSRAVFNERLLRAHFASAGVGRFGAEAPAETAVAFDPAVDRKLFRRPPADMPAREHPRRLLFYARPRNDRNCFALGLRALRQAAQSGVFDGEPWEFLAIGSEVPELGLSARHVLTPSAWLDYREYAALLGSSDLLLSLMLSPHTSYPPIEMAAAGNLAVTNTFGAKTGPALRAISPRIIGAPPTVGGLVQALTDARAMIAADRVPRGDVDLPLSWEAATADVVPWLDRTVRQLAGFR